MIANKKNTTTSIKNSSPYAAPVAPAAKKVPGLAKLKKEKEEIVEEKVEIVESDPTPTPVPVAPVEEKEKDTEKKIRKPKKTPHDTLMDIMKDLNPEGMDDMLQKSPQEVYSLCFDLIQASNDEIPHIMEKALEEINKRKKRNDLGLKILKKISLHHIDFNGNKSTKSKKKDSSEKSDKPSSIHITYQVDPKLTTFLKKNPTDTVSRAETMKAITLYVNENDLKSKEVKKQFTLDQTLLNLFADSTIVQEKLTENPQGPIVLEYKHIFGAISPLFPKKTTTPVTV